MQKIKLENQMHRSQFDLLLRFSCGLEVNAASVIISYITGLFPGNSKLNFLPYGQSCNDLFGFSLIFSHILLFETNKCEVIKSLTPILNDAKEIALETYKQRSSSSLDGSINIQDNPMHFLLSCTLSIQQKEPHHNMLHNIIDANLRFDDETLKFVDVLSCTSLSELELNYECSNKVNFKLIYTQHSENSKPSIGIEIETYTREGHLFMLQCLKTLLKTIQTFFGKCDHTKQIAIQYLSFYGCKIIRIDKVIQILFQQASLLELRLEYNYLDQNKMAQLLSSVQNSFIEKLQVRNNIVSEAGVLIKPFLLTLHTLTLHNGHITRRTWNDMFNEIIGVTTHSIQRNAYSAAFLRSSCTRYLSLRQLDISHNNVSKSMSKLALVLQCTPNLQYLNLQHTNLDSRDIQQFSLAFGLFSEKLGKRLILCKHHLSIQTLDMSENDLSGAMERLVAVILCMPRLTNLDLAETQLSKRDLEKFRLSLINNTNVTVTTLTKSHKYSCVADLQIKVLNLSKNSLSESIDHLLHVLECMPNITNLKLESSDLNAHNETVKLRTQS